MVINKTETGDFAMATTTSLDEVVAYVINYIMSDDNRGIDRMVNIVGESPADVASAFEAFIMTSLNNAEGNGVQEMKEFMASLFRVVKR